MLKILFDASLIILLILLAFSPAFVLRMVDKYILDKKNVYMFARDIFNEPVEIDESDGESCFNNPLIMERDAAILRNLNRMVKVSRKRKVKKLWKYKLNEYERKLKWMSTMDRTNGHETLPVI